MSLDARAAIIDTAEDTRLWIPKLKARGVKVVIRYLALGTSASLPRRRIIDNGTPGTAASEATQLISNGFGLILVYEWGNSNPGKFVFGVDSKGKPKSGPPTTDTIAMAKLEADADAAAAVAQAIAIGHANAPIYFTIDFDLLPGSGVAEDINGNPILYSDGMPVTNDTVVAACTAYFERLNAKLGKGRVGIYAGGWANERFRNLVTYSWVAQSPGFAETAKYLRNGTWHLFQQFDAAWFLINKCDEALDVDTDIQNPGVTDIGAFGAAGSYLVDASRTQAIFDARYVAIRKVSVYSQKDTTSPVVTLKSCHNGKPTTISAIRKNCSIRIMADDGIWLSVDLDEDGREDGHVLKSDFVKNIKQTPDY
jgi:hypothetical protein